MIVEHRAAIRWLTAVIALVATVAAGLGIFYRTGPGPFEHESVRGETVLIYGRGLYAHMSAEVAPQGIAQDVVTLFLGVPLLIIAAWRTGSAAPRNRFLLAGTLGYFLVTYLFYLMMGMYNVMFLAYVILLSCTFFALALTLLGFDVPHLRRQFRKSAPVRSTGVFLIFNAVAIALLWLGVVVPPLLTGAVVPPQVEHYTTLVVQGLDLGLLLPLGFISGWLFVRREPLGYLLAPTYLVFLALLMTALTAKIVAMGMLGYSVIPAIFIIPTLNVTAIVLVVLLLRSVSTAPVRRDGRKLECRAHQPPSPLTGA